MAAPWSQQWFDECEAFHHRTLQGIYRHWCPNGHNLPTDETDHWHWGFCDCFDCECGKRMEPKEYPMGMRQNCQINEDVFVCPNKRFWNFWKHPDKDMDSRQWKKRL